MNGYFWTLECFACMIENQDNSNPYVRPAYTIIAGYAVCHTHVNQGVIAARAGHGYPAILDKAE